MPKFNPIAIENAIQGISFPANKNQIVEKAKENGADNAVLDMLNKLPEKEYAELSQINEELGGSVEEKVEEANP